MLKTMPRVMHLIWTKHSWKDEATPSIYAIGGVAQHMTNAVEGGEISVELPPPPFPGVFVKAQVDSLQREVDTHQNAINELREQMQQLLALEYKP